MIAYHVNDNSKPLNFREYKKNHLEFLRRFKEILHINKKSLWSTISGMLGECFKQVNDNNWWTVSRHKIFNFEEFKLSFKSKYWSETIQHIIRNDLLE